MTASVLPDLADCIATAAGYQHRQCCPLWQQAILWAAAQHGLSRTPRHSANKPAELLLSTCPGAAGQALAAAAAAGLRSCAGQLVPSFHNTQPAISSLLTQTVPSAGLTAMPWMSPVSIFHALRQPSGVMRMMALRS